MLLLIAGCQGTPAWMGSQLASEPVTLSIEQISPGTGGRYAISGTANLPDATQLTVTAIRNLNLATQSYAILDRQIVAVGEGGWQAQLNLWQPSATGQLQESWQADAAIRQAAVPEPTVTFLATLDPPRQPPQITSLPIAQVSQFTTDGELYLQVSKALKLPPPQAQTPPSQTWVDAKPAPVVVRPPSPDGLADPSTRSSDLPPDPKAAFR